MKTDLSVQSSMAFRGSIYDKFFKKLPNKVLDDSVEFTNLGHMLASPHWNRVAIGTAAIASQPLFDYYNPRVDKDTAKTSMLRTISKVIVGTGVGFCVRGASYKLLRKFAHSSIKEGSTLLTPTSILNMAEGQRKKALKLYQNAASTVFALLTMSFGTNLLIDAPLTTYVANKLIEKFGSGKDSKHKEVEKNA